MIEQIKDMPKLIATSVVRGAQQGESHGGVYIIDFAEQEAKQHIDWNNCDIDFEGRGWDRGLRGIEFHNDSVLIAASDELFVYDQNFTLIGSHRNPYLKHCHEIFRKDNLLFLTSTGFDSLLAFDLEQGQFVWGLHIRCDENGWSGFPFDPNADQGPPFGNQLHINMVYIDNRGVFVSGLKTKALLHVDGEFAVTRFCTLPAGVHNAQPFRKGVIFNDTNNDCVRYVERSGKNVVFNIVEYSEEDILFKGIDDSKLARQRFGRGLCCLSERLIAGGSSPSTVSIYDLDTGQTVASVNLTMDIRNAIHGLAVWPYS